MAKLDGKTGKKVSFWFATRIFKKEIKGKTVGRDGNGRIKLLPCFIFEDLKMSLNSLNTKEVMGWTL